MSFPASPAGVQKVSRNKSRNSSRFKDLLFATNDERADFIRKWSPVPSWVADVPTKRLRGAEPVDPITRYSDSYLAALHLAAVTLLRSARRSHRGLLSLTRYGLTEDEARRTITPAGLIGRLRGIWLSEHAYEKHARALRRRVMRPAPPPPVLYRYDTHSHDLIREAPKPVRRFWRDPAQLTVTKILSFTFPADE